MNLLKVLKKYKLLCIVIILLVFPIIVEIFRSIYLIDKKNININIFNILMYIDYYKIVDLISGSCLSTAIIGFAYEIFIRNENDKSLRNLLRKEILLNEECIKTYNASEKRRLLELLLNTESPNITLNKHEIELFYYYSRNEYWQNYNCNIILEDYDNTCFKASITMIYTTSKYKKNYKFIAVGDQNSFNDLLLNDNYEVKWLIPTEQNYTYYSKFDLDKISNILKKNFLLKFFSVNNNPLNISDGILNRTLNGIEYTATTPDYLSGEKEFKLIYTYECLLEGNALNTTVAFPTYNINITFDYSKCKKIIDVDVFDYFNGIKSAKILNSIEQKRIQIIYDSWTLPKGGAIFIWNEI